MLGWIPFLGPIIQGISGIVTSITNLGAVKLQTASATTIAETNASVQIIQATNDDVCLRILRDALCLPVVVWTMLIGWDTIVVRGYPQWVFTVEKYPASVEYLPYAVIMFLLGNIGINAWKNR